MNSYKYFIVIIIIDFIYAEFLSSTSIEKCYQNGTDLSLNCKNKMVVSLSIENAQGVVSEHLVANINSIPNQNGSNSLLQNRIRIEVTKTPVFALFPLTYVQDFNNKPTEHVIPTSILGCYDGYYSDATCGFAKNEQGEKIMDSQGYCCSCDIGDFFGISDEDITRGKICSAFNLGQGSQTAHCLKYDQLWYSAFQIQAHQIYYEIHVNISQIDDNDNIIEQTTLDLGSSIRVAKNADKTVIAKVIGDFYPTNSPADLSNKFMIKPSYPKTHPRVLELTRAWMFIDRELVSLDGSECNKIGVGYSAFKHESNNCEKIIGSCIRHQIDDIYKEDLQRISNGLKPKNLLSSLGNFKALSLDQDLQQTALLQQIDGTMATFITLELNADKIQFRTILGIGTIDLANINDFESHSNDGQLVAQISNIGQLSAEFNLEISCSKNVAAISSEPLFLSPYQTKIVQRDVRVTSDAQSNNTCELLLKDAIGNIVDTYDLNFTTTALEHQNSQNNNTDEYTTQATNQQPLQEEVNCDQICASVWDIICYIANGCTGNILLFFSIIVIMGLCCCCIHQLIKRGYCCCCNKKDKKKKKKKQKKEHIDEEKNDATQQKVKQRKSKYITNEIIPPMHYINSMNGNNQYNQQKYVFSNNAQQNHLDMTKQRQNQTLYLNVNQTDYAFQELNLFASFSTQILLLMTDEGYQKIRFLDKEMMINYVTYQAKYMQIDLKDSKNIFLKIQEICEGNIVRYVGPCPLFQNRF